MSNRRPTPGHRPAPGPGTTDELRELIRELNGVRKDLAAERKAATAALDELKTAMEGVPGQIDGLITGLLIEKAEDVRGYVNQQTKLTMDFLRDMHAMAKENADRQVNELCDKQIQMLTQATDLPTFAKTVEKAIEARVLERLNKSLEEQLANIRKQIGQALRGQWHG